MLAIILNMLYICSNSHNHLTVNYCMLILSKTGREVNIDKDVAFVSFEDNQLFHFVALDKPNVRDYGEWYECTWDAVCQETGRTIYFMSNSNWSDFGKRIRPLIFQNEKEYEGWNGICF